MPATTRPSIVSFALNTLTSAVACAVFLSPAANAAGLGKLTVLSALGQPLRAEIELTAVAPDEAAGLVAKLAPAEAFRQANIDFNPTLLSLRFEVEQRNGRQLIRVSSSQAVNEPFVDMLLELNWTGGRLVREYTFLLDPAEMRSTQSAQVAAPVDLPSNRNAAPAAAQAAAPAAAPAPAPAPAADRSARAPRPAAPAAEDGYKVKPGDSLSRIAKQLKPVDVSLDLMLVALYRANPEAFMGKNMNRLKSGQILALPDADAIRAAASDGEAHGVVVAHAADFNAYRNKLAGQVATSAPAKEAEPAKSAGGKITAKVEERATAANEAKDQLKLSKATPPAGGKAGASLEDKIAKEQQMAEAAARVKELEKNVSDLEKLMAVKSKAAAEKTAPAAASASAKATTPTIDLNPPAKPEAKQPPPIKTVVVPPRSLEPSLADTVMDNLNAIGVAAAALLAGVGAIVYSRRRKQQGEAAAEPSLLGEPAPAAAPPVAPAGGENVDTNNSVFNSNFAPSASQLDTNEVDPVAEADVYIAYGRDAQAEEILKEALRSHPDRSAVRLKLLEIYATRKDPRAFETQASELYALTRGEGGEWAQAVALGLALDPYNPLYAAGPSVAAVSAAAATPAERPPEPQDFAAPFDHGMDFGLDQPLDTALPVAPAAAPAPAEFASSAGDNLLDFDLGGLSLDPVPAAAVADQPSAAVTSEEPAFDLAFDLAFDSPAPAPAVITDEPSMDFGIDLPEDRAEAPAANAPTALPSVGSDPLADLDMMDFDLPSSPAPSAVPTAAPAPSSFASDFADLELPDMGLGSAAKADGAAPEFDLSDINLDLEQKQGGAAAPAGKDEPLSAIHMEMDTKLDLAIAYQEIGDKEGARELLDEVLRGGSDDQVAKANAMRALLG
ncbi:pilus assembly protein FimV [Janthinobacterium sp. BJB412]|nr:pilus assembly protein FimV [Janthinobacterium sp. BJB412]